MLHEYEIKNFEDFDNTVCDYDVAVAYDTMDNGYKLMTLEIKQDGIYKERTADLIQLLINMTEEYDEIEGNSFTLFDKWDDEVTVLWYLI